MAAGCHTSSRSSLANSALSEMKAKRASALVPMSRSTESAVPSRSSASSTTRNSVRLAEAFEAADVDLGIGVELASQQPVPIGVVAGIERLVAVGQLVERRHGQIEVALVDQPRHLAVEEGDQERGDVGAVDVGVGHDDHARIAQILLAIL